MDPFVKEAALLRVIAHPARLRILDIVRRDSECVCHLSAALGRPQPYISQHLAILRKAGVVVDVKDGTNVYYGLASKEQADQLAAILGPVSGNGAGSAGSHRQRVAGCPCPKCRGEACRSC